MDAIVIYESLTGNTARAAERIAQELGSTRIGVLDVCPSNHIDLGALSKADLVLLGTWTHGIFIVGQAPFTPPRIKQLPAIAGKKAASFLTYALNPGRSLDKLDRIIESRGGESLGGIAINRRKIEQGAETLVDRLVANLAL
jgi:hypothetical protein